MCIHIHNLHQGRPADAGGRRRGLAEDPAPRALERRGKHSEPSPLVQHVYKDKAKQ